MVRTEHVIINDNSDYNPRGGSLYKCLKCGRIKWMRHLRPSSEIGYWLGSSSSIVEFICIAR